jgi:cell shape-determining protein MreC
MLKKSKERQKKLDEKYWGEKLEDALSHQKREHELEIQEKNAEISMLQDTIKSYKQREKELDTREYMIKKNAKENSFMATKIASKVEDFGIAVLGIVGEMKGVREDAEKNKLRIESK